MEKSKFLKINILSDEAFANLKKNLWKTVNYNFFFFKQVLEIERNSLKSSHFYYTLVPWLTSVPTNDFFEIQAVSRTIFALRWEIKFGLWASFRHPTTRWCSEHYNVCPSALCSYLCLLLFCKTSFLLTCVQRKCI